MLASLLLDGGLLEDGSSTAIDCVLHAIPETGGGFVFTLVRQVASSTVRFSVNASKVLSPFRGFESWYLLMSEVKLDVSMFSARYRSAGVRGRDIDGT